jgi:hypothetical protein
VSEGFEVDVAALHRVRDVVEDCVRRLAAAGDELAVGPDAGRSSGEVDHALAMLAGTLDGLVEAGGSMAANLDACAQAYTETDQGVLQRFDGLVSRRVP